MVNIHVKGILIVKVLQAILCKSTIYTFNNLTNKPITIFSPHSGFLRFLLIKFFIISIIA